MRGRDTETARPISFLPPVLSRGSSVVVRGTWYRGTSYEVLCTSVDIRTQKKAISLDAGCPRTHARTHARTTYHIDIPTHHNACTPSLKESLVPRTYVQVPAFSFLRSHLRLLGLTVSLHALTKEPTLTEEPAWSHFPARSDLLPVKLRSRHLCTATSIRASEAFAR